MDHMRIELIYASAFHIGFSRSLTFKMTQKKQIFFVYPQPLIDDSPLLFYKGVFCYFTATHYALASLIYLKVNKR